MKKKPLVKHLTILITGYYTYLNRQETHEKKGVNYFDIDWY